ncbi:MAG TPA: molybdate ABC transporter substrate-binding protein [Albidovulum sp.]|uniref:molybdate ABC transporter substrate-binding protein n=1 Tax=Albidovulum sp. TaxID=1872424 RepID=UPI002C4D0E41|nr:molybdate ABC transporter substrate-binding protein [Albidovulum sp.]
MPRFPLALPLLALLAGPAAADEVVVFAAASMKTALDRVASAFEAATGHSVTISYAGSNALARQIIEGAPADIFISANTRWMDEVEKAGLIADGSRRDILGNTLVLVATGADAAPVAIAPGFDLKALVGDGKLAMALVDAVPAGQYGKAALENLGAWDAVAGSVAQADNVRAALALVVLGEAPFGIVYATDAAAEPGVSVAGTFPAGSYPSITYPAALLTGAGDPADRAFLDALSAPEADAIFADQGFAILD